MKTSDSRKIVEVPLDKSSNKINVYSQVNDTKIKAQVYILSDDQGFMNTEPAYETTYSSVENNTTYFDGPRDSNRMIYNNNMEGSKGLSPNTNIGDATFKDQSITSSRRGTIFQVQ